MKLILALAGLLAAASPLAAQVRDALPSDVDPGDRVKVTTRAGAPYRVVGTVVQADPGRLVVTSRTDLARVEIPMAQVAAIEVYRGRHRRLPGMLGAAMGAVAGYTITLLVQDDDGPYSSLNQIPALVLGAPLGAIAGGSIGYLVGAPRWERVPVPPRMGAASGPDGGTLHATALP